MVYPRARGDIYPVVYSRELFGGYRSGGSLIKQTSTPIPEIHGYS